MTGRPALLDGIRVVDLSMGWAGPLAARHLADMGAEVIKVESCARFDWWRGWEATPEWIADNSAEKSPAFNMVNRNKLDVTLDLTSAEGSDLLKQLVAISDVVVENYSGDVLPKLGLDYAALAAVNPEIVMISMPAFGTTGPWQGYRAYGSTVEQASGLPHLSGEPDWQPTMVHVAYGDAVGGLNGAAALLTALRHRHRTGEGQHLDLSQSECLFPLGVHGILEQSMSGDAPVRRGNRSVHYAPHGVYPASGDDRWVAIQVFHETQWRGLKTVIDALAEFGDLEDRLARVEELDAVLATWTRSRPAPLIMETLQAAGVPAGATHAALDLVDDPQLQARDYWQMIERKYVGLQPNPVAPYRDGTAPYGIDAPAPTLGQHNRQVLGGLLGLSDEALTELEDTGIIGSRPVMPGNGG